MGMVSLIVMEPGSLWPGHVGGTENVVAAGSDQDGLRSRTEHMLDVLRARQQHVRVAVLACNDATDFASAGRRAEVAGILLRAVASSSFGRLVVCASGRASLRLRQQLLSLTGELVHELSGTTATVGLRFGEVDDDRRASAAGIAAMGLGRAAGQRHSVDARS